MSRRIIFLITDPAEWAELEAGEPAVGGEAWERFVARSFEEAAAAAQARPVGAFVAGHRQGEDAAVRLVNWAAEHFPGAVRLIVAEAAEREDLLRRVLAPHHFLARPVTAEVVTGTLQSAFLLEEAMPSEVLLTLASRIRVFPPMPSLYFQVLRELKSLDYSAESVGRIVAKDLAMTTRLLQVINSGAYGLPRRITDLSEAVLLLGQETVNSLIVGIHLFLENEHLKPLYFSMAQLWQHSTTVARGAWLIAQMETGNADRTEEAYGAGLLHDIGKLALANNFEAQYNQAQRAALRESLPLWQAEMDEFGVSHAELGALILGRWGMPLPVLEAAAFHHQPVRGRSAGFSTLTAVHVADAISYELHPMPEGRTPPALDLPYLESIGLAHRVDAWRECLRLGKVSARSQPRAKPAAPSDAAHESPLTPEPPDSAKPGRTRMMAVAVLAALAALGWYWSQHQRAADPIPARAATLPRTNPTTGTLSAGTSSADASSEWQETNVAPANPSGPPRSSGAK